MMSNQYTCNSKCFTPLRQVHLRYLGTKNEKIYQNGAFGDEAPETFERCEVLSKKMETL